MISAKEKDIIIKYCKKYDVGAAILFGSAARSDEYNDIDLGVTEVADDSYYAFCGDIFWELDKPVDIIDLNKRSLFTQFIQEEGIRLYEKCAS